MKHLYEELNVSVAIIPTYSWYNNEICMNHHEQTFVNMKKTNYVDIYTI